MSNPVVGTITRCFLTSSDFNGLLLSNLTALLKKSWPDRQRRVIKLLQDGKIALSFYSHTGNPHIKRLPDLPLPEQLAKLTAENPHTICAYPSADVIRTAADLSMYDTRPFTRRLALAEAQLTLVFFDWLCSPPAQLIVSFPLDPTMHGIRYGQDMFFIGFPYGIFTSGQAINRLDPIAFVKKAIMSASVNENGVETLFLDGHNNPGFSGGPIAYRDLDRRYFVYKMAGVVSGFRFDSTSVLKPEEIKPEQVKPEGIAQARII